MQRTDAPILSNNWACQSRLRWSLSTFTLFAVVFLMGFLSGCTPTRKNLTVEQKLEDFSYLFSILEENHPYLALKARVEGYDWLSHRQEFEQAVGASTDDKDFAQVIAGMLRQINNGHTNVSSGTGAGGVRDMANWNEEPWKEAAKLTSPERTDYWYRLAYQASTAVNQDRCPPFLAVYNNGQYVVAAVAPEEAVQKCVRPGMTVLKVGGLPVQDYIVGQRDLTPYRRLYDPIRKRLYQRQLTLSLQEESLRLTLSDGAGQVTEVSVPCAQSKWDATYPWPPKYTGKPGSPNQNLYTDILADGKVGYIQIASFLPLEQDTSALTVSSNRSVTCLPSSSISEATAGG